MNDPRLGRFLSFDPLAPYYPELTPYQFAGNTPIWAIDVEGLEPETTNDGPQQVPLGNDETTNPGTPDSEGTYIAPDLPTAVVEAKAKPSEGEVAYQYTTEKVIPLGGGESREISIGIKKRWHSGSDRAPQGWMDQDDFVEMYRTEARGRGPNEYHNRGWGDITFNDPTVNEQFGTELMRRASEQDIFNEHLIAENRKSGAIHSADPTFDVMTAGIGLPFKFATLVKGTGATIFLSGVISVPKRWVGMKASGTGFTLLSTTFFWKMGYHRHLGKQVWTLWGPARYSSAALGRNMPILGAGIYGLGEGIESISEYFDKKEEDEETK